MQASEQSAIFNIFHDGTFLSLQKEADDIHFRIEIQYLAKMIDPDYTCFTGIFKNAKQFLFKLWEDAKRDYKDISVIGTLLLNTEISNSKFEENRISVYCLGADKEHSGGTLLFSCESIIVFDEGQKEVTFDDLQEICRCYWNESF